MKLHHYSRTLLPDGYRFKPKAPVQPGKPVGCHKPHGLWLSDDDDFGWHDWCQAEDYGDYEFRYEIEVVDMLRVLHLDHEGAVRGFIAQYGIEAEWASGSQFSQREPDWNAVAENWAGVLITPYQWGLRLAGGFMWYYGWDCASGVFWDTSVLGTTSRVPMPAPREKSA